MNKKDMARKELFQKGAIILLLLMILMGALLLPDRNAPGTGRAEAVTPATGSGITLSPDYVRGVWISYIDFKPAGLYNKSESVFTQNADQLFKQLKKDGINTAYVHVIPKNNAIYPSKFLKWCTSMGKKRPNYDPLEILVEKAHKYDISFHAWINPYRKTMKYVFNPAKQASTNRILREVREIIQNYDVDGIHFDDYFYPSKAPGHQYSKVSVANRKKAVNKMIRSVYKTVKKYNKKLPFGISPAGNIEYAESIGCDLDTWLSTDGYVDYILPQIYWSDQYISQGHTTKLYTNTLHKWTDLNQSDTPMYVGLALYKAGVRSSADPGWTHKHNNIVTQIKKGNQNDCQGFVLFSYAYMNKPATKKEMTKYRKYVKRTFR